MINMITWIACFLGVLVIPVVIIILGKIFRDNPPKEINGIKGYRTKRSMASQEAWDYANRLMGKIYFIVGICLLAVTVIVHCLFFKAQPIAIAIETFALVTVQSVAIALCSIPVEKSLKEKF